MPDLTDDLCPFHKLSHPMHCHIWPNPKLTLVCLVLNAKLKLLYLATFNILSAWSSAWLRIVSSTYRTFGHNSDEDITNHLWHISRVWGLSPWLWPPGLSPRLHSRVASSCQYNVYGFIVRSLHRTNSMAVGVGFKILNVILFWWSANLWSIIESRCVVIPSVDAALIKITR